VEDFRKILFDIGAFGFRMTGGVVALLWGTKLITDSRADGSLEVKLAAPVSRATWIVGRYLGLLVALGILAVFLLALWQGLMLLNNFGWMTMAHRQMFAYLVLEWAVVAAVAVSFATFCRNAVALFATACFWVAGMMIPTLAIAVSPETPAFTRQVIEQTALLWNLSQFNLVEYAISGMMPSANALFWLVGYGVSRIVFFLAVGTVIFSRRDLIY
jgi:ABC-type transport system involved in multi-copper enzyme maturation permease subunit